MAWSLMQGLNRAKLSRQRVGSPHWASQGAFKGGKTCNDVFCPRESAVCKIHLCAATDSTTPATGIT